MTDLIGSDLTIDAAARVTLHFSLALSEDRKAPGSLIDATPEERPATFAMGDGSLLPGFEERLLGLRSGDQRCFVLEPTEAFGEHQSENIRQLPVAQFNDITLEPGLLVSFASPDGELPGLVQSVQAETVTIDFNHPLAGRRIWFSVDIVGVEPNQPDS